ncbi:MAG: HlyD family efflux transporter periplasmic adaptor subunit [Clostridiales bacterium]|nr:HlyD family efflux transporter periplasmic adaptor subunit [Clostridiales bacterium]
MKKLICFLVVLMLLASYSYAEERFDGQVIAGETISVTAPFGGVVKSAGLRVGTLVQVNDIIATLSTGRILATEDGTIRGLFAKEGDSASGTVMYLAPVSKFTVSANIGKAYESAETMFVTIGEKVYLRCSKDGSHKAEGVVTAVKGSGFTVQTTAGELYMEESVNIYRTADYSAKQCIGSGTVSRTDALAITGSGSILTMHVQDGDEVERGQLLFETVEGDTNGLVYADSAIRSTAAGVVAEVKVTAGQQVRQDDVVMTVYRPDAYQIRMEVPEDMLSTLKPGDACSIYFNWNEGQGKAYPGVITEVSFMNSAASASEETTYSAYVAFQPDETVRLGMNVTVVLP